MKRLCTFLVLLASACAYGQVGPVSITSAECAPIGVGPKVSVITFQVTGTWTGTLQPKITVQGQAAANVQVTPSTSTTAQSTVTANGIYTAQVNGADTFQVCGNTVASGTANVYLNVSVASKGGSSSGTSGTVTSIATTSPVTGGTITGTGTIACATCAIGPGSSTANHLAKFSGTDGVTLADGGAIPAGTVTSIATTSPVGGGTITGTGTLTCATCVVASSPGAGVAHFAGSTQTATSSAIVAADITSGTITGTQLSSSIALPNGATATTQSASDNSTKVATTAYVDRAAPAMVQLETHTGSNSATLDFTTCFTNSSYHTFKIKIKNLVPATNSVQATLRMSTDGGATYDATSGIYDASSFVVNAGGTGNEVGLATTSMQIGWQSVGNTASNGGVSADFDIYDPANGANAKVNVSGNQMYWSTSSTASFWAGSYHSTVAVNAFRILFSAGNITSGTVTCYGITP